MGWLGISIVLTVVINVALRAFPRAGEQIDRKLTAVAEQHPEGGVYFPWKAMIIGSLVLTIGLNLIFWILR